MNNPERSLEIATATLERQLDKLASRRRMTERQYAEGLRDIAAWLKTNHPERQVAFGLLVNVAAYLDPEGAL